MAYEREQALGKFTILKKQIYTLATKAQSMVSDIQEEVESFLNDKDFSTMDFNKVGTLASELKALQKDYADKIDKMKKIQDTFNFTE